MSTISAPLTRWPDQQPPLFLALAAVAWVVLYLIRLAPSDALVKRNGIA